MKFFRLIPLLASLAIPLSAAGAEFTRLNDYLGFTLPIDPRVTYLMPDYQISQSIGTSLVRIGADGSIVAGLADRWEADLEKHFLTFHIDSRAKWSDGTAITSTDVMNSFKDLKTNFSYAGVLATYSKIERIDDASFRFILKAGASPSATLMQLTPWQCGLVKIVNGKASTQITSGPYSVKNVNKNEIVLTINPHWLFYSSASPKEVHLRRDYKLLNPSIFLSDKWPDMAYLGEGVTKDELSKIPKDMPIWRLNHDRLYELHFAGRSSLAQTRSLIGLIRARADFQKFASLLDDGIVATQFYAKGLALHSEREPRPSHVTIENFRKIWPHKTVRIAYFKSSIPPKIAAAAEAMFQQAIPIPVEFITHKGHGNARPEEIGQYDLFFGTLGADPENLEGSMVYFFKTNPVHIPSGHSAHENFVARFEKARTKADPVQDFRDIFIDAIENNYFLPIAHYSIVVLGRKGIDFSKWTRFGEFLPYHAVRKKP